MNNSIKTIKAISSEVKTWQIYFILGLALLGACLALAGLFMGVNEIEKYLNTIPEYILMMGLGMLAFLLFFPFTYLLFLCKVIDQLDDRLKEFENQNIKN